MRIITLVALGFSCLCNMAMATPIHCPPVSEIESALPHMISLYNKADDENKLWIDSRHNHWEVSDAAQGDSLGFHFREASISSIPGETNYQVSCLYYPDSYDHGNKNTNYVLLLSKKPLAQLPKGAGWKSGTCTLETNQLGPVGTESSCPFILKNNAIDLSSSR